MRRTICGLVVALLLSMIVACGKANPGPNVGAITPGVGVTEVSLGDSKSEVLAKLGQPDTDEPNPFSTDCTIVEYYQRGLEIAFDQQLAASIVIHAEDGQKWKTYQGSTKEGAWTMHSREQIEKLLGGPTKELDQALIYPGLWVRLDKEGKVESFSIGQ